jgi:hypothetical protein
MVKKMLPAAADHLLHSAAVSRTKSSYRLGAWPISEVSVATSVLLGAKPRLSLFEAANVSHASNNASKLEADLAEPNLI